MKRLNSIMCKGLAVVATLLLSLCVYGQDTFAYSLLARVYPPLHINKEVLHSSMVGCGASNVLDTYLSPYNYTGTDFRVQRETQRMTTLWQGRVSNQSLIDLNVAINKNHLKTKDEYAGGIRYSQGWFYNFMGGDIVNPVERSSSRWNFAAGLAVSAYLGAVYIDRSGNNPAQAKADFMIDASGMVSYDMTIAQRHYLWRYQVSVPMMGIAFSPNYGQSYYEAFSLRQYDHNVLFAYPGNMPSMRHRLTLDMPIRRYVVRVGYVAQFNQSVFNHLKYHSYTHDFMIGFNKYLYRR
ncbi:MAG: DUF3316 domain-containing protein [Bacteroidaceae bacterium]|nr:DUF3316 domain-containing protein [Bacteroidaceae bacterium]